MIIRRATVADRDALVEAGLTFLRWTNYAKLFADHQPTAESLGTLIDALFAAGEAHAVAFVAVEDAVDVADPSDAVFGMIAVLIGPHPFTGATVAEELAWWVDPSHRGSRRAGPALLKAAEEYVIGLGLNSLKMVAPTETIVGTFLEHAGYLPFETAYVKRF